MSAAKKPAPQDLEGDIAIPLQDALTFARLMSSWFEGVARDRYPAGQAYFALNDDERETIAFGFSDLVQRLAVLDQRVSGPDGISPR